MNLETDRIKSTVDQKTVIGTYVKLRRSGRNWVAPCPFHKEREPSFTLHESGAIMCYGCQWKGDIIKFVQDVEQTGFKGAVEILRGYGADTSGIESEAKRRAVHARIRSVSDWYESQIAEIDLLIAQAMRSEAIIRQAVDDMERLKKLKSDCEKWAEENPLAVVAAYDVRYRTPYIQPIVDARATFSLTKDRDTAFVQAHNNELMKDARGMRSMALTNHELKERDAQEMLSMASRIEKEITQWQTKHQER